MHVCACIRAVCFEGWGGSCVCVCTPLCVHSCMCVCVCACVCEFVCVCVYVCTCCVCMCVRARARVCVVSRFSLPIYTCDMTHSYVGRHYVVSVWCDSFPWRLDTVTPSPLFMTNSCICDMTHLYVSRVCVRKREWMIVYKYMYECMCLCTRVCICISMLACQHVCLYQRCPCKWNTTFQDLAYISVDERSHSVRIHRSLQH